MGVDENDDDEWEYEYSTIETETFYVDLDLSSVNGVLKSKNAGERKTLKRLDNLSRGGVSRQVAPRSTSDQTAENTNQNEDDDNEEGVNEDREDDEDPEANSPTQIQTPVEPGLFDEDYSGRFQILDFHTTNPIISYNGNIYSCSWHDMLGTTMFITKHQEAPFHEPEISTEDYDLIGTSRIKLVGKRARIAPKAGSKKRNREEDDGDDVEDNGSTQDLQNSTLGGRNLGTITRTNPKTNIEIKQQASFLEKLMEIKKARGDTDTVRTFVDRYTVSADARQARKAQRKAKGKEKAKEKEETAEQRLRREINELNKRVVKGDNDALKRLQEIYADMEEVEDDEDEILIVGPSTTATLADNDVRASSSNTNNPHVPLSGKRGGQDSVVENPHARDKDPNGASGSAELD